MYRKELETVIEECLKQGSQGKTSTAFYFEEYAKKHGIESRKELDRTLFWRMYGREPDRSERQRVRFWRLSQHLPRNREEGILLGKALELSGEAEDTFLSDFLCFRIRKPKLSMAEALPCLFREYLSQIPGERLAQLNIEPGTQERFRRHIFYADAIDCIWGTERMRGIQYREHLYSKNFSGELKRYFQEETILSREKVIRLLTLLLMPDVDADVLNEWLRGLGYAPLDPERAWNGYVDRAILKVLGLSIRQKPGERPEDRERMKRLLAEYDHRVLLRLADAREKKEKRQERLLTNLRFMKFRSFMSAEG